MQDATLEEQQTLDSMRRNYQSKLENVEATMAEGGLAYSSERGKTEKFLGEETRGLVQSTTRGYKAQLRALEQNRKDAQTAKEMTRMAGETTLKELARAAEQQVGTEKYTELGLTNLSGQAIKPLTSDFVGESETQRRLVIANLASILQNFENPQELTNLFNL